MIITAYFIIGLAIVAWTSSSMAEKNPEKFKKDVKDLAFWLAAFVVAALWPLIVGWAFIDAARIYR